MERKKGYVKVLQVAMVMVFFIGGISAITFIGKGFTKETPKEQKLSGFHKSDEPEIVEEQGAIIIGEENVVNTKTIGYTKDELLSATVAEANKQGVGFQSDAKAVVYEGEAYDTALLTRETSPVQVTAYISKLDGLVSRVSVGTTDGNGTHQKEIKDTVKLLVSATNKTGQGVQGVTNNLLSVTNGEVRNEVLDGLVYSTASSKESGVMMFIEGQ